MIESKPSEPIRLLLVDDHPLFRDGVKALLRSLNGFELVAEATNGVEGVRLALELQPDVVLMDIAMPTSTGQGLNGLEATRQITNHSPHISVVILTMFEDDDNLFTAMRSGARGYILKGSSQDELLRVMQATARGEALFSASIAQRLMTYFTQPKTFRTPLFPELTKREHEVLECIAQGLQNQHIATRLELSHKTVRNHISNIFSKLQVADRTEAIFKAKEAGLG
jgi:DNA-binding NarL/FixJ family response regulator